MTEHQTLGSFLAEFGARDEMAAAIARTVKSIADSCCAIAEVIALGPLGGSLGTTSGENADGDAQAALDLRANEIVIDELSDAPVAYLASEELDLPLPLNEGAPLYVAIDPLDGSSNLDTCGGVGTIFSVLRHHGRRAGQNETSADCGQAHELAGHDRYSSIVEHGPRWKRRGLRILYMEHPRVAHIARNTYAVVGPGRS